MSPEYKLKAEGLIKKFKESENGGLSSNSIAVHLKDGLARMAIVGALKDDYGLIRQDEKNQYSYYLTSSGWRFKSFKNLEKTQRRKENATRNIMRRSWAALIVSVCVALFEILNKIFIWI